MDFEELFEEFLEEEVEDPQGRIRKVHRANPSHPNFEANLRAGHTAPGAPIAGATVTNHPLVGVAPHVPVVPTPAATTTTAPTTS